MEETTTRNRPSGLLVVFAVLLAVAAVWATTALARGGAGSGPSQPAGGTTDPWSFFVQDEGGRGPSADDCPERDGGGSGGSGGDSGSDGSSNPSL